MDDTAMAAIEAKNAPNDVENKPGGFANRGIMTAKAVRMPVSVCVHCADAY